MNTQEKREWYAKKFPDTQGNIARKSHISHGTYHTRLKDMSFTADELIRTSRAYHVNPIETLIAFGYLRPDDAPGYRSASQLTTKQLLNELNNRVK